MPVFTTTEATEKQGIERYKYDESDDTDNPEKFFVAQIDIVRRIIYA